jgi:hypothetical protein
LDPKLHGQEEHVEDSFAIQVGLCSCGHGATATAIAADADAIAADAIAADADAIAIAAGILVVMVDTLRLSRFMDNVHSEKGNGRESQWITLKESESSCIAL